MNLLLNIFKSIALTLVVIHLIACTASVDGPSIPDLGNKPDTEYDLIVNQDSNTIEYNSMMINTNPSSWRQIYKYKASEDKDLEFGGWAISGDGCYAPDMGVNVRWQVFSGAEKVEDLPLPEVSKTLSVQANRVYKIYVEVSQNSSCDFGIISFAVFE